MNSAAHLDERNPAKRTLRDIVNTLLFVLDESGGEVTDELDAIGLELADKVEAYHAVLRQLEAEAEACAAMQQHYQHKAKTKANQSAALERRLLEAMQTAGIPKIKTATVTAYTQQSTSVEVEVDFCEHAADRFVRVTTAPDKKAIGEALKEGSVVEGARLTHTTSLRFR